METITLNDGTIVKDAYVVKMDNQIAIYGAGEYIFSEVYDLFGTSSRTSHMESDQYGDVQEWDGYVVLTSINIMENGYSVCLHKEESNA